MTAERDAAKQEGDRLYEQYARPLERDHWGRYIAIMPDGRILLGDSVLEAAQKASNEFGPGSFLFKIGPKAVFTLR